MNILSIAIQSDDSVAAIRVRFDEALSPAQENDSGLGWTVKVDGVTVVFGATSYDDTHTLYLPFAVGDFPPGAVVTIAYATPPGVLTGLAAFSARVIPRGPATVQVDSIATLLAQSATFQAWVDADDATEAAESIHPIGLPTPDTASPSYGAAELSALRPFAIVNFEARNGLTFSRQALGMFVPGGTVVIGFEADVETADARNFDAASYKFLNMLGSIVEEMLEAGEGGGYPVIQSARIFPPRRADPKEVPARGDFMVALVSFDLGLKTN